MRRGTFLFSIALLLLVSACGDDKSKAPAAAASPGDANKSVAAGKGLLIPRDQRLVLRDMSSGGEQVIGRAPASVFYAYPRWSPDGKKIAYVLKTAFNGAPNQEWGDDIALNTPDGGSETIVLKRPQIGTTIEGLAWIPDGSGFYAGILETQIKDNRFIGQSSRLERIDLATGARTKIVDDAGYPTVSPDGGMIAYITYGSGDTPGGLWTAKPDGSNAKLIVQTAGRFVAVAQPRFSPDGATIAFSATAMNAAEELAPARSRAAFRWPWNPPIAAAHGLPQDVWAIAATGGAPRRLTNFAEDEPSVAWSPDGAQLAIVATGGLYEMTVAGGDAHKIGLGGTTVQIDWR